jgi:DNA-binding IclR family transcriptional regulator
MPTKPDLPTNPSQEAQPSKTSIQVIERLTNLLDALAVQPDPMGLKALAHTTGLHPSTTHRILNDLVAVRLVDRSEDGNYRLGMRLLELGTLVKARLDVRKAATEWMRRLHRQTGHTINLSVRQGDEIIYIDRAHSERSGMQVVRAIGGRAPLHLTSTGKLFLAQDNNIQQAAYAQRTRLLGYTVNSITELAALHTELNFVASIGFARDNEELELGVRCMAAGIYDDTNTLVAGLSISAPTERLNEAWAKDLQQTAQRISRALGWRG